MATFDLIAGSPHAGDAYLLIGSICLLQRDYACAHAIYDQGLKAIPGSASGGIGRAGSGSLTATRRKAARSGGSSAGDRR